MEKLRTFVILAIFIILSAGCIYNMVRRHKEEKAAKEAEKLAKKRSRTLVNKNAEKVESVAQFTESKAEETQHIEPQKAETPADEDKE